MARISLRQMKWLFVAMALACAACGGSTEKHAEYATSNVATAGAAYPSPPPQSMNGASSGETLHLESMAPADEAPAKDESYSFSDDALAAGQMSPNDSMMRTAPPPPQAPPKPVTSPTDKKIANVDIDRASDVTTPTTKPGKPGTSTAANE